MKRKRAVAQPGLNELLLQAATYARSMQLFYHDAHNQTQGDAFLSDHEFFGESYENMEDDYDVLAEYLVAGGQDIQNIKRSIESWDGKDFLQNAVKIEEDFRELLGRLDAVSPLGLQNALGDMVQKSDVRSYKMQQRLNRGTVASVLREMVR
jgi:DNA-binding ferritin-like protein